MATPFTIDAGEQTITFKYLQDATGESFNTLLRDLMRPGVYEGGLLTSISNDTVEIQPLTAVVYAQNKDDMAVRVRTAEEYQLAGVSSSNPYIILRYNWFDQVENFVQPTYVSEADISTNDPTGEFYVILGKAVYDGATMTGIDYSERRAITQDADTLYLGEGYSIDSQPTGGTTSQFIGESTVVTQVLTDIYNRLKDLSGVENNGVQFRHVDKSVASGIHGNNLVTGNAINYEGSDPGTHVNTTNISYILQFIYDKLKDLSGVNNQALKRRHIDFGMGSSQISLKDFTLGKAGSKTIDGSFSNINYLTTTDLDDIIQDILGVINELAQHLNGNTSGISTHESRITALENEYRFAQLPIGCVMMYDAIDWTNNKIPGWFVCDGTNGTPDLKNRFIKAHASGQHGENPLNNMGGDESRTLGINNLPRHDHNFVFNSASGSAASAGSHSHSYRDDGTGTSRRGAGKTHCRTASKTNLNTNSTGAHTHPISISNISGTITSTGQNNPTPIPINPSHYSIIFIKKMT